MQIGIQLLFIDENLPIKNKTKHSTKEEKKKLQDERTQVLADKEFS
jgi:hypothetical protein